MLNCHFCKSEIIGCWQFYLSQPSDLCKALRIACGPQKVCTTTETHPEPGETTPQLGLIACREGAFIPGSDGCIGARVAENADAESGWEILQKGGQEGNAALVGTGRRQRSSPGGRMQG